MWTKTAVAAALVIAALAGGMPGTAGAWPAQNGLSVDGSGESFTVDYRPGSRTSDYWCAAGDFVIGHLGLRPDTRVFRLTPERARPGQDLRFSVTQAGGAGTGLVVIGRDDGSLSAATAQQLCENRRRIGNRD